MKATNIDTEVQKEKYWPGDKWWYYELKMELFKQMHEEEERLAYKQHYREAIAARQHRLREEADTSFHQ
ncbi:hypothetical protein Tco_1572187 [Tanacetum coccineum]